MTLLERFDARDRQAFERIARAHLPYLDAVLPSLTSAADKAVLWWLVAGGLLMTGRPDLQRAGLRGLLAISLASPTANLLAKQAFRRERPVAHLIPVIRRRRIPTSSSFPSGHSASAVAFAVAVAAYAPVPVAAPVSVLAAGVAFSRVYVGAHYPGDVAVGMAIGLLCGWGAIRLRRRRWDILKPDSSANAPGKARVKTGCGAHRTTQTMFFAGRARVPELDGGTGDAPTPARTVRPAHD
ncbi:phosphatase PAP2 family protein [Nonomuraea gerenzanensis]|uniref:Integral membrane protein n=1 Tax=Nonomuraea gerenzanensis TaxID=93944 RepID=A0A1M4EDK2_9ACTN|nr:phosphatase PAP2 family protein [Nonomuraea gerenzanensis]UBU08506.1 phosphatase PAP2 family protein [Nonomuraea gerenzanensis]SBO96852.1 integral membrane protein [Nonomuraea gerenzanensis]